MRDALGKPLQNISNELLNKVVSKEVQQNLRKFKMSVGKTPSKENRRLGQTSAEKGANPSPQRRLQFTGVGFGSPDRAAADHPDKNVVGHSREVRDLLKELDNGVHDKVALLKMLVIKCSDADSSYKKIR